MKKSLLTSVIILMAFTGFSQLNNSWIDYNKTYYKFRISRDSLCRIYQPSLPAALSATAAQNFQLWRNGKEVRLYTSIASGVLGAGDYIEFWGEMNDGKPDKNLYLNPDYQLSDKYSLETDTVMYYLTVNLTGNNLRFIPSPNIITGNTLPAENYFMRKVQVNYKSQINRGAAAVLGEYVYSSAYDKGEGWASNAIPPGGDLVENLSGLNVYTSGPPNSVTFTIGASGNGLYTRDLVARFYSTPILIDHAMPFFEYAKDTVRNISNALLLSTNDLPVSVASTSTDPFDRIVVSNISVTYPATFTFNNQKNFYFELGPNAAGDYLVINSFNFNGIAPVLYDISSGRRYLGDLSSPGQVKFVLPGSTEPVRKFNLMSQDLTNIMGVAGFTAKTFINYANTANQGNYLIISHPALYNDGSGINNVELYRQYRSSVPGGAFKAVTYDINELTEQFGFGIKKHPSGIRDFIRYAVQNFSLTPKYVFLIGRAIAYTDYTIYQSNPLADQTNLVQTFGFPASDILLASEPGTVLPLIPIGRLGAINGIEVGNYYRKMVEYEQVQQNPNQTIANKGWMKNFLHTVGGSTPDENNDFLNYVNGYKKIVEDTLYGANVSTYVKASVSAIELQQSQEITQLFHDGLSYVKYFGHSSANELGINLNYPDSYDNAGKYPFMHVSGCTVGNFYTFSLVRATGYPGMSLTEKYVLLDRKGSIGFLGSTHWGIPPFLNFYNTLLYKNFSSLMYGNTVGNQIKATIQSLSNNPNLDFFTKVNMEEINLQGDPALKLNFFSKPDYVIEDPLLKITPNIISVADSSFKIDVKWMNIGLSIHDSIRVTVKQQLPTGSIKVLFNKMVVAPLFSDSLHLVSSINPITDKGLNKLMIELDADNRVVELSETNNTLTREFYIFEDELRPISPYNYAIVNQQGIPFYASTANPLSTQRQYLMEIDTSELFNSPFKKIYNSNGAGGIVQFNPGNIGYTDSTVYYWRTSTVPTGSGSNIWNTFSFVYLPSGGTGYNQSHYYQFQKNAYTNITLDNDRVFRYMHRNVPIDIRTAIYPYAGQTFDFSIRNDGLIEQAGFYGPFSNNQQVLRFYVIDTSTNRCWVDIDNGISGLNGSIRPIPINTTVLPGFFQFKMTTPAQRKNIMNFLDSIPVGFIVAMTNTPTLLSTYFPADWRADTAFFGSGNSLYHKLKAAGFSYIDSLTIHVPYVFAFKKGTGVAITQTFGKAVSDLIDVSFNIAGKELSGQILSDKLGPAKKWNVLHWRGKSLDTPDTDSTSIEVYGIKANGSSDLLASVSPARDTSLSWINTDTYPFLKLRMLNTDSVKGTPQQLRYWRINATLLPEGAVMPNLVFATKDTVDQGEPVDFKLAFKNISSSNFDSLLLVNLIITDRNNVPHIIDIPRRKALVSGDTLIISYRIDTKNYPGANTLFIDVNPANDQPEQYHFNNVLFKDLYVRPDVYNPLLDVTFDGVHILNRDIVSSKPHILVNLKDESKFLALKDTALLKVQVRFPAPDQTLHTYYFGDTMKFTPANLSSGANTASIDFMPWFKQDGEYELIVSGKDVVGNQAGKLDYHVLFNVISKPMISNLLNYPNPFTTSTAFVFSVTGSEVPQNIRIQILTITGKVVREITKDELGPLHIGRNITEFKWDGTDSYGAKLANGVYLYRVLTNLNGKSLDKYKAGDDNTDKYFNKGYGKMVILR